MAANSEIGVLQPLAEIAALCRERGVPLHSDAAQAVGKLPLDVQALGVDLLSFCAHKLYGPKGVGALYVRRGPPRVRSSRCCTAAGRSWAARPGTLPVPLIVGFAKAVELCLAEQPTEAARLAGPARRAVVAARERELPDIRRNGHASQRLPGNLNVSFAGVEADALLVALRDVALSTGSACASGSGETSHVLRALGLPGRARPRRRSHRNRPSEHGRGAGLRRPSAWWAWCASCARSARAPARRSRARRRGV